MRFITFKFVLSGLLMLAAVGATAQTAPAEIAAFPERSAGIYHSYEYIPTAPAPVPEGYTPFYISHYGRHGSRYHLSEKSYSAPLAALRCLDRAGVLTPLGRETLTRVAALSDNARQRYGDLTRRGVREHRAIARRMFEAWPEVFTADDGHEIVVESRSTTVPRVILSMAAFNERLKESNPAIIATREASERFMDYLAVSYDRKSSLNAVEKTSDSLLRSRLQPARFMRSIADEGAADCVDDPLVFMQ